MKKLTAERKKIIDGRARKDFAVSSPEAANENLRILLRRAVHGAPVPADLEAKVRNLLWKQF